jgi:hypothetical protein
MNEGTKVPSNPPHHTLRNEGTNQKNEGTNQKNEGTNQKNEGTNQKNNFIFRQTPKEVLKKPWFLYALVKSNVIDQLFPLRFSTRPLRSVILN